MANMFESSLGSIGEVLTTRSRPRASPDVPWSQAEPPPGATPRELAQHYTAYNENAARRWGPGAAFRQQSMRSMRGAAEAGFRAAEQEEAGIAEAQANFRQAMNDIMQPALSDRDVSDLYAGMLEDIAQQKQRDMMAVTEYSGAAGLRGGVPADMLAMVELGALGNITRGMRDLRKMQADMASQHKITQLNALGLGAQVLPMVSTLQQQNLAMLAENQYGMFGTEYAGWQADKARDAQERAALVGGLMNLGGGVGGALVGSFA